MKKQEEFKIEDFERSLVLGFLREYTDLYDKDKENEFLELLVDFITEHDKRMKEEVIEEIERDLHKSIRKVELSVKNWLDNPKPYDCGKMKACQILLDDFKKINKHKNNESK